MKQHINILGFNVKDKVTQYEGVVTSVCFELYGCIQVIVQAPMNVKGEIPDGKWFDITRLEILSEKPVTAAPDFEKGYISTGAKGAQINKPLPD